MDQSVIAYRTRALNQRGGWQSTGAPFNAKALEAANLALVDTATMFPDELLPDVSHQVVYPDVNSSASDVRATIQTTTDSLVLELRDEAGTILSDPASVTTWVPTVDGTWDGGMWLEIQDPDGQWHRRQSLEWWSAVEKLNPILTYYVSLDRPWRNLTDDGMAFRIVQEALWFPGDIVGPKVSGRVWDGNHDEVTLIDTADARDMDMRDTRGETTGPPTAVFPGTRRFEMNGPRRAPAIDLVPAVATEWIGPWQTGTFRFFATYVWGRADAEWQDGTGGIRDPIWESPPSPVSTTAVHTAVPFRRVMVGVTNIDEMMGFGDVADLRYGRTGRRVRIYVYNDAFVTSGIVGAFTGLEADGIAYLLTEIEPTDTSVLGTKAQFVWDGSVIPDLSRRYRRSTGYRGWNLYPVPDQRYEIDFDISRFPRELSHDYDVVPVREDAGMVYFWLFMAQMSLLDGNDMASFDQYQKLAHQTHARLRNRRRSGSGIVTPKHYSGVGDGRIPRTGTLFES